MPGLAIDAGEARKLREASYNATVTALKFSTPTHRILRIRPDSGLAPRRPGQYIGMGLGAWEPTAAGDGSGVPGPEQLREMIVRHYSFSHPMVDDGTGGLIQATSETEYEFFISMTPGSGSGNKLSLTPRLMALEKGDRIYIENEAAGEYTLDELPSDADVIFAATGTGQSAHNAMAWELLHEDHPGRIVTISCTRHAGEQAYSEVHRALDARLPQYTFISLVTREDAPGALRCRIQSLFEGGKLEEKAGWFPSPEKAHVFLCGNPAMIGAPARDREAKRTVPRAGGMVELLTNLGFSHKPVDGRPASIHYERFW